MTPMAEFPHLRTGAVMQYPARRTLTYSTQVLRFLDGCEQRYREQTGGVRKWIIQLELLEEREMDTLDQFFRSNQGRFASFSFVDPWDGNRYEDCSLENDEATLEFLGEGKGRLTLVVKENRG